MDFKSPADRMIPANTKITDEQFEMLKEFCIPDRVRRLKKCRHGDMESALWIMQELEHLRNLLKYNEDLRESEKN